MTKKHSDQRGPRTDRGITLAMIALKSRAPLPKVVKVKGLSGQDLLLKAGRQSGDPEGVASFDWESSRLMIAEMPVPIPWSELEGPCRTALQWETAAEEMKTHSSQLLVTLIDKRVDPIDRSLRLTEVISNLLGSLPAIGVYWGSGAVLTSASSFPERTMGSSREYLPLPLWVTFHLGMNDDKTHFGFTQGLEGLGIDELEVLSSNYAPGYLFERLFNFAHYVLDAKRPVSEGDTIGMSAEEKIRVNFRPSHFGGQERVMQLTFPK